MAFSFRYRAADRALSLSSRLPVPNRDRQEAADRAPACL